MIIRQLICLIGYSKFSFKLFFFILLSKRFNCKTKKSEKMRRSLSFSLSSLPFLSVTL